MSGLCLSTNPVINAGEILKVMLDGNFPEGSRTVRRDILDGNGRKIGEKVIQTYSSGKNRPSKELVKSSYPPVNIYTDGDEKLIFEFACAGYDPENISFEVNKEDHNYINLVLSSGSSVEENSCETDEADDKKESEKEVRVYEVEGFKIKDTKVPFFVDNSRYNIETPTVEIKNGVVKIAFEPKRINFKPKLIS